MASVSTCGDFLDALRAALVARAGLSGVAVYTGPVSAEALGAECIVLATEAESGDVEQPLMGGLEHFEEYSVGGFIWVNKPGAGETVIASARDRAFDILEEVHDYLASLTSTAATVSALGVDRADLRGWTLEQFAEPGERHCMLKFSIDVRGRFTPA